LGGSKKTSFKGGLTVSKKHTEFLNNARTEFVKKPNWIDFSNKFFGIGNPYVPSGRAERREFLASPEYAEVRRMLEQLQGGQPDVEDPSYSGKILIRIGGTLHRHLAEEAAAEGIPLNQLILAKLAPPLYDRIRVRRK
jgi:hypothetical protein